MSQLKIYFVVLLFCFIPVASQTEGTEAELTRIEIEDMVDNVCQLMMDNYVYPDIAEKICETLRDNLDKGQYDVSTYMALAELLSRDLKSVNQDLHLNV